MPSPRFLTKEEVLRIHDDQIRSFGGAPGLIDEGLLDSALAQAQVTFNSVLLHKSIYEQAAAYLYHLIMNHPFLDGNKRTAFAVMDTFLRVNGYKLTLKNNEAYDLVISVANCKLDKANLIKFLKSKTRRSG
ncbi:MAG: type II toxin-antitoxin system death-on-curing family toxin [Gloeomargarita sp. SKYG116]|nr:type II toxin-antitoxin system death-on-curing family toxin [Gloeomargarita sp. SKYG116]MCS7227060.1 type II toxin-antitoxin system death-on-curing family toxin [Gloeomargarita sp. SKYB31]MDW8402021.1 type II toxin-antitoxin system death-on-curing family toxin [Gloeomargarita sp. SKYGB_i_bin116]